MRTFLVLITLITSTCTGFYINDPNQSEQFVNDGLVSLTTLGSSSEETLNQALAIITTNFEQNPIPCILSVVGFFITVAGIKFYTYASRLKRSLKDALDRKSSNTDWTISTIPLNIKPLQLNTDSVPKVVQKANDQTLYNQLVYQELEQETRLKEIDTRIKQAQVEYSYSQKELQEAEDKKKEAETRLNKMKMIHSNNSKELDKLHDKRNAIATELAEIAKAKEETLNRIANV